MDKALLQEQVRDDDTTDIIVAKHFITCKIS